MRAEVARYGVPAALLAAATAAVLLVRAGLDRGRGPEQGAPTTIVGTAPGARPEPAPRPARGKRRERYYAIREGDTLDIVAGRFRTTVERLERMNPGIDSNSLRIGQRVRVS